MAHELTEGPMEVEPEIEPEINVGISYMIKKGSISNQWGYR